MTFHLAWIRTAAATAVAVAGVSVGVAQAQYLPFRVGAAKAPVAQPAQQAQPVQAAPAYPVAGYPAARQPGTQPAAPQQGYPTTAQPAYTAYRPQAAPASVPAQYPQYTAPAATQYPQAAPQQYSQAPAQYSGYPNAGYPTYPSVAQQSNGTMPTPATPPQNDSLPAPGNANGSNGAMNGNVAPVQGDQGGCNCAGGYPSTCYTGTNCNCNQDYGLSNYMDGSCDETVWFGGLYYLFMERDDAGPTRLAVQVDDSAVSYPYYPPASTTVLTTADNDHPFRSGAEIRFGSTFSVGGGCDSGCGSGYGGCGCNSGCGCCPADTYAWEVGYWALDDDEDVARTVSDFGPVDNFRYYSMKNFAGIEYDRDGAGGAYGYRPVNVYYDYSVPVTDPVAPAAGDIRVVYQAARANFQAQNLELNFLRLPMSCCTSSCGGCGGCDSGCGGCGGCDCGSAFSVTGLCGARYLKIDDDFAFADTFTEYDGAAWGANDTLTYQVNVDNRLVGFQLGANMNYCIACRWNLFCDSNFGLYDNIIDVRQRVYGAGNARFINTGNEATVNSDTNSVAFLGEWRLGGAYDVTCNWRLVAAYRAIAMTGLALSNDQIPENFSSSGETARINNNGSMIIHGIQVGAECRY